MVSLLILVPALKQTGDFSLDQQREKRQQTLLGQTHRGHQNNKHIIKTQSEGPGLKVLMEDFM